MDNHDVYAYIQQQENNWKTVRIPLTVKKTGICTNTYKDVSMYQMDGITKETMTTRDLIVILLHLS